MFRILKRRACDERGQSSVEIALVLPVLLLMLAGLVDFGRAFQAYIVVTNAAREGARYGSLFPDDADGIVDATTQGASDIGASLDADDIDINDLGAPPGGTIRVTVTYLLDTILGSVIGASSLTIRGSTAMVVFGMDVGP